MDEDLIFQINESIMSINNAIKRLDKKIELETAKQKEQTEDNSDKLQQEENSL